MELLITTLGWIGSFEVITAYALNSYQKVKSDSITFQVLNLTGAIFLIINSIYKQAYPFTLINAVWSVIAIVALAGIIKKRTNQKKHA